MTVMIVTGDLCFIKIHNVGGTYNFVTSNISYMRLAVYFSYDTILEIFYFLHIQILI